MFKILKGVSVGGGLPGLAYGGGIYNMSCSLGQSGEPTKVTLNIVSENGTYMPPAPNVTSGGKTFVTISDGTSINSIFRLYPYKFTENATAGAKTLSVSLVDQSAAFDKIYVGLTARHAPVDGATTHLAAEQFNFSVRCLECNKLWPKFHNLNGNVTRSLLQPNGGGAIVCGAGDATIDGGYIILGKEQWTDGNCEIPAVEYGFSDLCNALTALGFQHQLMNYNRSDAYTAAYSGTLKEVLNSWASDFCFSFTIDPFNAALTIVSDDLTNPVGLGLANAALNGTFFKGSGNLIRSRSQSYSLEGSFIQTPIIKNIKPARGFSRKQISYAEVTGKPITVKDAIGEEFHNGRTDAELEISICLAKYQPQARLIWLSDRAAQAHIAGGKGPFPCLGFMPHPKGHITDDLDKQALLEAFGGASMSGDPFNHPVWSDPDNYDVFLGVYNEKDQAYGEEFDRELSEFYGKYGYFAGKAFNQGNREVEAQGNANQLQNPPPSNRECPISDNPMGGPGHRYYDFAAQISTLPNGEYYKGNSYPFKNILRVNSGAFALSPAGGIGEGDYIFPIEDNCWGTDTEWVDQVFSNQWVMVKGDGANWPPTQPGGRSQASGVTDLEHYIPIYARFNSNRLLNAHFRDIIKDFDMDFMSDKNVRLEGYFPGVAIIPKMDKMIATSLGAGGAAAGPQKVLEVLYDGAPNIQNAKVYDNARRKVLQALNGASSQQKTCIIYCEEDIVSDLCNTDANPECNPDDPVHRFTQPMRSAHVELRHLGNSVKLIFPVMKDYRAFWKADMIWRGTYPKLIDIKGSPPANPGNVMSTRIVDYDVTGEMDQEPTANGFNQSYIVNGAVVNNLGAYEAAIAGIGQAFAGHTETINVKIDGISYGGLPITPAAGLSSFNISVDGEGMSSDLVYSSRPPKLPKKDIFVQKFNAMKVGQRHGSATPPIGARNGMPFQPMGGGIGMGGGW